MTGNRPLAHRIDEHLYPDLSRVVARLYLPGEEIAGNQSRVALVVQRVLRLTDDEVDQEAEIVVKDFAGRHRDLDDLLYENALRVSSHVPEGVVLNETQSLVMGAAFTAEFAVEGAALCNPSVVVDPDQSDLLEGETRLVLSVRAIGEGHVSSLGFASAIVGPGRSWRFLPRQGPLIAGRTQPLSWVNSQFRTLLEIDGVLDDLSHSILAALPEVFTIDDFRVALAEVHTDLLIRPNAGDTIAALRRAVSLAYESLFPMDIELSQQVLLPAIPDERAGIEDARLVRFTDAEGNSEYRATYTAYNGHDVGGRLIISGDLRHFHTYPMTGPAARNKGVAIFPRLVDGRFMALCRSDGETTSITRSDDGLAWDEPVAVHEPTAAWEVVQVGNCGSPIELAEGWLVLTHGVGPMRTYAIGAVLLDLEDPTKVLRRLETPLIEPAPDERNGYVPNVVYSCGGIVHEGTLWLPFGIGDSRIGVAWISVDELLDAMTSVAAYAGADGIA